MIFLSHTVSDKPVVEPIAMALRSALGQKEVFYDSWSIQPGDGIIDEMNKGLTSPSHVFFFVSRESLASPMCKLEWQNALYKATKGQTKMIPVRVDGADMPAVLMQNLYIDLHTQGVPVAIAEMLAVVQGGNTFQPQHQNFENLSYKRKDLANGNIQITISAAKLAESNVNFAFTLDNQLGEATVHIDGAPGQHTLGERILEIEGMPRLILGARPLHISALSPKFPITYTIHASKKTTAKLNLVSVMHEREAGIYYPLPDKTPKLNFSGVTAFKTAK